MKIQIISLFPDVFKPYLQASMLWKASDRGIVSYELIDLRDFGIGPRKSVDDTPYGGGDGMLFRVEPVVAAIEHAKTKLQNSIFKVILPTPRGKTYQQSDANRLASKNTDLIIVCPRYEGYDERITNFVDEQFSVGNYVLTGGELPALTIIDSVVRLLPGVLGGETSTVIESFQKDDENIEFPQYTRPEEFRGMKVPDILLTGHHAQIEKWRSENSQKSK